MITDIQKWVIDQKDGEGLKTQISILEATTHKDKAELMEYCDLRLDRLNQSNSLVEVTETRQGEFFQ